MLRECARSWRRVLRGWRAGRPDGRRVWSEDGGGVEGVDAEQHRAVHVAYPRERPAIHRSVERACVG
eukprot:scaffold26903_cov129-Isochrysis_galbana.AAC.7